MLPQIDDNGLDDAKSVRAEFERLGKGPLSGLRLAMLHGQMETEEKHATMTAFRDRQTDVLVATTVIEVGIDVPNATVMRDRQRRAVRPVSQLHQLRGRVGRGSEASHCLLIADANNRNGRGAAEGDDARRPTASRSPRWTCSSAAPASSSAPASTACREFKLADITQEMELLQQAREDALEMLASDPKLARENHRKLRDALIRQFGTTLQLAQIG